MKSVRWMPKQCHANTHTTTPRTQSISGWQNEWVSNDGLYGDMLETGPKKFWPRIARFWLSAKRTHQMFKTISFKMRNEIKNDDHAHTHTHEHSSSAILCFPSPHSIDDRILSICWSAKELYARHTYGRARVKRTQAVSRSLHVLSAQCTEHARFYENPILRSGWYSIFRFFFFFAFLYSNVNLLLGTNEMRVF